jgi:hypothetical protein
MAASPGWSNEICLLSHVTGQGTTNANGVIAHGGGDIIIGAIDNSQGLRVRRPHTIEVTRLFVSGKSYIADPGGTCTTEFWRNGTATIVQDVQSLTATGNFHNESGVITDADRIINFNDGDYITGAIDLSSGTNTVNANVHLFGRVFYGRP